MKRKRKKPSGSQEKSGQELKGKNSSVKKRICQAGQGKWKWLAREEALFVLISSPFFWNWTRLDLKCPLFYLSHVKEKREAPAGAESRTEAHTDRHKKLFSAFRTHFKLEFCPGRKSLVEMLPLSFQIQLSKMLSLSLPCVLGNTHKAQSV